VKRRPHRSHIARWKTTRKPTGSGCPSRFEGWADVGRTHLWFVDPFAWQHVEWATGGSSNGSSLVTSTRREPAQKQG
jgi:hypothetical protein